ncbi:MAG: hypothetical protein H8E66_23060 [Planctomycetes bacterium]|nr:hypothetical protein [Planctomycetota bacterium]
MTSRHLNELMDVCRPGHNDVNQPELKELASKLSEDPTLRHLFARSQEVDAAIRTSFQAVAPPPGLAERLLDAIPVEEGEGVVELAEAESRVELAKRSSRRSFAMWGSFVVATSLVVAAILFSIPTSDSDLKLSSPSEIAETVGRWNADLEDASWQSTETIPDDDFPTWQHLGVRSVTRWEWVSKPPIACYDFKTETVTDTVRLFVMKPTKSSVAMPTVPPLGYPLPNGWYVGAWQGNDRVYFLAVRANRNSKSLYSRMIRSRIPHA